MNRIEQARWMAFENLTAALRILADVEGFGGDEALAVQWARLVLKNQSHLPLTTYELETKAA